jgi:tetratricopeptide (TPR) repeat protein
MKIYVQQENWQKALENANKWKDEEPDNAEPYLWIGYIYSRLGDYKSAGLNFFEGYNKNPKFYEKKEFEKKLSISGQNLLKYDQFLIVLTNSAIQFYNEENYDDAIKISEFIIKLDPNNSNAYQIASSSYQIKAQKEKDENKKSELLNKSRQLLEAYNNKNPNDPKAKYYLALFYYDDAQNYLLKNDTINHKQSLIKAKELLESAVKLDTTKPEIYFELAEVYFELGDYKNASINYEKSSKLDSTKFETFYNLAISYMKQKNYNNALKALFNADKIKPNDYQVLYFIALLYFENKDDKNALEYVNKAISVKETSMAYELKANILKNLKKNEEALKAIEKAEELKKKGL